MIQFRRSIWKCSVAFMFTLCQCGSLWAQVGAEEEPEASWVISYALILLSVGLGLFVVCRPGNRSQKVKAETSD